MQLLEQHEALEHFPSIYRKVAPQRPGMFERSDHWWQHRVLSDPEQSRNGATAHRRVLHTRDGEPAGYVIYRTRTNHIESTAEVRLVELIGIDPQAEKSLWQFIFGIDLVDSIMYWNLPADDPVHWWLEQPRRMERKIEDSLWVRPVDVAAALSGRRYSSAGTVVFRMRDELCPWNDGVYRLDVDHEGAARCQSVNAEAELDLTPYALGATFLGGHRFGDLARAGLVKGTPVALQRADSIFKWDPLPWCQEVF
jgi:predicted acetyltransferase